MELLACLKQTGNDKLVSVGNFLWDGELAHAVDGAEVAKAALFDADPWRTRYAANALAPPGL